MTRFIHDQFAKDYLEELLSPLGEVEAPKRVSGEARPIDVAFVPSENPVDRSPLGVLGQMAVTTAIFEPFRNPVTANEIRDCLLKLLELDGQLRRESNRDRTRLNDASLPRLWILTPTASDTMLSRFGAQLKPDWEVGIYFLAEALRTAIVVVHRLPSTPETLWVRLLGRGTVQKQAIDEFVALPEESPYRAAVLELLYNLQQNLSIDRTSEEDRELIMRLAPLYQQERERAIQEGIERGIRQEKENIAVNLLALGMTVEQIATVTGLSVDRILELQASQASSEENNESE